MDSSNVDDWIPFVFWVTGVPGEWSADHLYNELRRFLIPQVQAAWILPAVPVGGHAAPTSNLVDALLIFRNRRDEQLFEYFVDVWLGTTRLLVVRQNYAELMREMLLFQQEFVRRRLAHFQNRTLLIAHRQTLPVSATSPPFQAPSSSATPLSESVSSFVPPGVGSPSNRSVNSLFQFSSIRTTTATTTSTTTTSAHTTAPQPVASSSSRNDLYIDVTAAANINLPLTSTSFPRSGFRIVRGSNDMQGSRAASPMFLIPPFPSVSSFSSAAVGEGGSRPTTGPSVTSAGSSNTPQASPPTASSSSAPSPQGGRISTGAVATQRTERSEIPWVQQWPANWRRYLGRDFISPLLFSGVSITVTAIEVREILETMFGRVRFALVFYRQFVVELNGVREQYTFGHTRFAVVFEDYSSQVNCLNTREFPNIRPAGRNVSISVEVMNDVSVYAVQRYHEMEEAVRSNLPSWQLPQLEHYRRLCIRSNQQGSQHDQVRRFFDRLEVGWNLVSHRVYVLDCQNAWIRAVGVRMQLHMDLRYQNLFR